MTEGVKRSLKDLIEERDRTGLATSVIYWGDNLEILGKLPQNSVDLIYLDPPFSPDRKYWDVWGENSYGKDEALIKAYEEACSGGKETYIRWIENRVELMHQILKETGSLYFHCDPQLGHYFKVMLDRVFGDSNTFGYNHFQNEIVWCYRGGGVSERTFARKHDTILFYSKTHSPERVFNVQYVPYSEASTRLVKSRGGVSIDGKKRDLERGAHMPDWWIDIISLQTWSPERTGYKTQKPESLVERIIKASSNPGDIVLDPFCGCGTTPIVAHKLGRRWIGIDIAEKGYRTIKERLEKLKAEYCSVPWDLNERQLRELEKLSGNEFKDWVVLRIHGISKRGIDGGVDLYTNKREPVQVKKIKTKVGPGILRDFRTALRNERKNRGYIISFYGFTKGATEEANRYKREGLEIKLLEVKDIPQYFD